jgi:hypothetical protein
MLGSIERYQRNLRVSSLRADFRTFTANLDTQGIATYMGMLNHILPIAFAPYFQFKGRKRSMDEKAIAAIARDCGVQKALVATGVDRKKKGGEKGGKEITGMTRYIRQWHPNAHFSRPTLIKYRKNMEDLGLFTVAPREFSDGRRKSTEYTINILEALLFFEALEEALLESNYSLGKSKRGFLGILPPHKCFSVVELFNTALGWLGLQYRRVWEDEPLFGDWGLNTD